MRARDRQTRQFFLQRYADHGYSRSASVFGRQVDPNGQAAQATRPGRWPPDRGPSQHSHAQGVGRIADRPRQPRARCRRSACAGAVSRLGSRRVGGRRARLSTAHSWGVCLLGSRSRTGRRKNGRVMEMVSMPGSSESGSAGHVLRDYGPGQAPDLPYSYPVHCRRA